jgi:hypothetical protein
MVLVAFYMGADYFLKPAAACSIAALLRHLLPNSMPLGAI